MSDCAFPNCTRIAQKTGLCIGHNRYADSFPTAIIAEEFKRINRVSDKRKVANRELAKIVARIKKERPECEMRVPGVCTGRTVTAHHVRGKVGKLLLDEKNMMAACSPCNLFCESNDAEAREAGLKITKHDKDYKRVK